MLPIFILEDDERQRTRLENMITNYIFMEDLDMKIVLSTGKPQTILDYIEENNAQVGLYFLDVELNCEIDGLALGAKIRKLDVGGSIVFVTSHTQLAMTIFKHKIEALDYIIKDGNLDQMKERIIECIQVFQDSQANIIDSKAAFNQHFFKIQVRKKTHVIPFDETMFFQNSNVPNRIDLHLENGRIQFRGTLKEVKGINPAFVQVHRSVVVNRLKVKAIHLEAGELEMTNGERCIFSTRGLKELKKAMNTETYSRL